MSFHPDTPGDIEGAATNFEAATRRGDNEDAGHWAMQLVVIALTDLRRIAVASERLVGDPPTHVNLGPG